jgi:hypothetical protein
MRGALSWLETGLGVVLVLFVFLDFFLTVLYARIGSGIMSQWLGGAIWRVFRAMSMRLGSKKDGFLAYCGPVILILLVAAWGVGLTLGSALIIHPQLGVAVFSTDGPTATDFGSAVFAAASSLSIVGSSDFAPKTRLFDWLFFTNSLAGMSVMFLTTTYVLQVYSALQSRNAFALKVYLSTRQLNDAAQLLAGAGPRGRFEVGYAMLGEMAGELVHVKESHHFYPLVFYFRFKKAFYSASQFVVTLLDAVTLLDSALNDDEYTWLKQSGAVSQLQQGCEMLVEMLNGTFVAPGQDSTSSPPDARMLARWSHRYRRALDVMRAAGIRTVADEHAGFARYIALRSKWNAKVTRLCEFGAYQLSELMPVEYELEPQN